MAQLIDITRVVVGTEYLTATVRVSEDAPLMTSEDLEATTRIYNLLPTIIDHACVGDAGSTFKDCMGDTELAHLLEHVTVELLARTNLSDAMVAGRTWREFAYDRTYSIQFDCVDDVLVAGALSSAVWILDWAFDGGFGPVPDVEATVAGLVELVRNISDSPSDGYELQESDSYGNPYDEPYEDPYEDPYDDPYNDAYEGDSYNEYADDSYDDYDQDLDRGPRMSRKIL